MFQLIGDIGGTNARLALIEEDGKIVHSETLSAADHKSFQGAIEAFLAKAPGEAPQRACFAVACPLSGDLVEFTNNPWSFSVSKLKAGLSLKDLFVINDFEAMARCLPHLAAKDVIQVGAGQMAEGSPKAVLGPGTGLGMAALITHGQTAVPLATEGGHARFAPANKREQDLNDVLVKTLGFVCNEDLISGRGLVNIYNGLCELEGVKAESWQAAEICSAAVDKTHPIAEESFAMFWAILGSIAGDFALQTCALGGVYISGGIAPRYVDAIKNSEFRSRFVAKGTYRKYLEQISTFIVIEQQPGLIGAASVLTRQGES